MKSVFIIDDHDVFRDGLKLMLEKIPGIRVCGECGSGDACLYEIFTLKPDAVLMDFHLHAHSSIGLTKAFNHIQPRPVIILMTMSEGKRYQQDALAAGASALVMKPFAVPEIQKLFTEYFPGETGLLVPADAPQIT